jgi:hypothetical protein
MRQWLDYRPNSRTGNFHAKEKQTKHDVSLCEQISIAVSFMMVITEEVKVSEPDSSELGGYKWKPY